MMKTMPRLVKGDIVQETAVWPGFFTQTSQVRPRRVVRVHIEDPLHAGRGDHWVTLEGMDPWDTPGRWAGHVSVVG